MKDFSPEPAPEIISILTEWFSAHKLAENNPELLTAANSQGADECTRVSNICAQRMERTAKADEELYKLYQLPQEEYLPIVRLFLMAGEDRGCPTCWLSSSRGRNHPDCNRKIDRWFGYKAALMAYVEEVYGFVP